MRSVALAAAWGALVAGCGRDASRGEVTLVAVARANGPERAESHLARLRAATMVGGGGLMPIEEARGFDAVGGNLVPRFVRPRVRGGADVVALPVRADAPWTVGARGVSLDVTLLGAAPSIAATTDTALVYEDALGAGTALVHVPLVTGTEELVHLEAPLAQAELRHSVALHGAAGLRLVRGVLEVIDAHGAPVLRTTAPTVVDALHRRRLGSLAIEGCSYDSSEELPFRRPPTPPRADRCVVVSRWDDAGLTYPVVVDPGWTTTARLITTRIGHTATPILLSGGGGVLVVGGTDVSYAPIVTNTTEVYDVIAAAWTLTDEVPRSVGSARMEHAAVQIAAQRVMVAGGITEAAGDVLAQAAVYDSSAAAGSKWTTLAPLPSGPRRQLVGVQFGALSVFMPTPAKAAFVGGIAAGATDPTGAIDVYDVTTSAWQTGTPTLTVPRRAHAAVGWTDPCPGGCPRAAMLAAAGGVTTGGGATDSVEIVNLATGTLSSLHLSTPRAALAAVMSSWNGTALFAGGLSGLGAGAGSSSSIEGFPSSAPTALATYGDLSQARGEVEASSSSSSMVFFAGGAVPTPSGTYPTPSRTADRVTVSPGFASLAMTPMSYPRAGHRLVTLSDTRVMAIGGRSAEFGVAPASEEFVGRDVNGSPCNVDGDCSSLHCADGVCCDSACTGFCQSCDLAGKQGTCTTVLGQTHGLRPRCPGGSDPTCVGRCDGVDPNACKIPSPATPCVTAACAAGTAVTAANCDGLGFCGASTSTACGRYACAGSACGTRCASNSDCASGNRCDLVIGSPTANQCVSDGSAGASCDRAHVPSDCAAGLTCVDGACCTTTSCPTDFQCNLPKSAGSCALPNGHACGVAGFPASGCDSGHCVDGVCCDSACAGQCEACGAATGTCAPVKGDPLGGRPACGGATADKCAATSCDGIDRGKCSAFKFGTADECAPAGCQNGILTPRSYCDAAGACRAATPIPCGSYACVDGTCASSCSSDAACATAFRCDVPTQTCVPRSSSCTADGRSSRRNDSGAVKACGAYRCNPSSGDCYAACTDSGECAPGSVCDGGACVTPAGGAATLDLPGCGVSSGGGGVAPGALGLLGALAGLGLVRRRARRALSDSSS